MGQQTKYVKNTSRRGELGDVIMDGGGGDDDLIGTLLIEPYPPQCCARGKGKGPLKSAKGVPSAEPRNVFKSTAKLVQ